MASERLRRLLDLPPVFAAEALPVVPAGGRRMEAWINALPRANSQISQLRLEEMLRALAASSMGGAQRLRILEELRSPVLETIALREREFVGAALPLPLPRVRAAQDVEAFHLALGHGYRLAAGELCSPSGRPPMLRSGQVLLALERAQFHYGRALACAWRVYRQAAHSLWEGLHRVYWFAVEARLADRPLEDVQAGGAPSAAELYHQALLVGLANPYSFSQSEQGELWSLARAFAGVCRVGAGLPVGAAAALPDDGDLPPGLDPGRHAGPWLDLSGPVQAIEGALAATQDDVVTLAPRRGLPLRIAREPLLRMQRAFGATAARHHQRLLAEHRLDAVIGLSGLHFYLAGGQDFEAFIRHSESAITPAAERAAWAQGLGENARVPLAAARVLDQSLGGYRLCWEASLQVRARVGELVGLSVPVGPEGERDWMVGVVRWLRYEDDGGVTAGVELLARRARAVGLRASGRDGRARPPLRAIEIDRLNGSGRRCFVAPDVMDLHDLRIEVIRSEPEADFDDLEAPLSVSFEGLQALAHAGEYLLMCAQPAVPADDSRAR